MDRRRFLQLGAGATVAGALAAGCVDQTQANRSSSVTRGPATTARRSSGGSGLSRPNLLVFITDQQRHEMHWPDGKLDSLQPSMRRLARHGLTFDNAFTSAAQCTPSRGAIMTGTYPQTNGVTETSGGAPLQPYQLNLGRMLAEAGYDVAYKGKWHLSQAVGGGDEWSPLDVSGMQERYGLPGWNPPDAGTSLSVLSTGGGGTPNNDGRIVQGMTTAASGQTVGWGESVLDYLEQAAKANKPFCLFVSLVNPHDVGFYPNVYQSAGYRLSDFVGTGIGLPPNATDSLETKPSIQAAFRQVYNSVAPINTEQAQLEMVNFYAYLHGVVEPEITRVLDALDGHGLTERTVIFRFSDHGEQAMSHGMVEKMFTGYEETIHVPLVISNPVLFPEARRTSAFWSHVDLFPTLAGLAGVAVARGPKQPVGEDMSVVIRDPRAAPRDSVVFSFDDTYGADAADTTIGGTLEPHLPAELPSHIRLLREPGWKYAVYFHQDGRTLQYEMYDLDDDPGELRNLAFTPTTGEVDAERQRLHQKLTAMLTSAGCLPNGFMWPQTSGPASAPS